MIDPATERPFGRHAPQFWPDWIPTFMASHVLAFGTHWRSSDYAQEARDRLSAGERLPFVDGQDDFYNTLLGSLLESGDEGEAALHYASSRGVGIALQQACMTLAEAARRAQVITRARPAPDVPAVQLPAHEWQDRERYRFSRNHLYKRSEGPLDQIEWWDVQFWAADVDSLRTNGLIPPARPVPESAAVLPMSETPQATSLGPRLKWTTIGSNVARAVAASGTAEPSKGELARQMASLWVQAGGTHRCADLSGLANSIEKAWAPAGWDRDALLNAARQGDVQG